MKTLEVYNASGIDLQLNSEESDSENDPLQFAEAIRNAASNPIAIIIAK